MRDQLKVRLGNQSVAQVKEVFLASQFEALDRICNNFSCEKYKRKLTSTASGQTHEVAQSLISDARIEYCKQQRKKGYLSNLKDYLFPNKNDHTTT